MAPPLRRLRVAGTAAYLIVALTPLGLCLVEAMPGRGFMVNLSVALGFVGLSVLGLQLVLAARVPWATRWFGHESLVRYHRQITLLAVVAALGHPVLLFAVGDHYRYLLNVLHDPLRAQLAWLSVVALVALVVTSVWRRALRLSYSAWHVLHSTLGVLLVLAALGHAYLVDYYTAGLPVRVTWAVYGAAFLWFAVYMRILRPLLLWQRPWVVARLHPEPGDSLTVTLAPRYRHADQVLRRFRAGQFAWMLTGASPFNPTYHPFSLSSSAAVDGQLEFTIKRAGDFTESLRALKVGDLVYLDGPHGSFTLEHNPGPGYVFLAAGVGVTPFLSMLATLADQGDQRPCWLFLGNRSETGITGIRQLHECSRRLDLTVVHVISRPRYAWTGERGRIRPRLLEFYLPEGFEHLQYFLCASPHVMAAYRKALLDLGVPALHIHSEQFTAV